jgi:predicted Rossmann-fold nucleotide-binding protein
MLDRGKISAGDPQLVQVVDDPAEVVQIILDAHKSGVPPRPGRSAQSGPA